MHNIILHFSCTVVALKSQNQISPGVVWCGLVWWCGGVVWCGISTDNNTTLGLYWGYPRFWQWSCLAVNILKSHTKCLQFSTKVFMVSKIQGIFFFWTAISNIERIFMGCIPIHIQRFCIIQKRGHPYHTECVSKPKISHKKPENIPNSQCFQIKEPWKSQCFQIRNIDSFRVSQCGNVDYFRVFQCGNIDCFVYINMETVTLLSVACSMSWNRADIWLDHICHGQHCMLIHI